MKKRLFLGMLWLCAASAVFPEDLAEVYKKGTVRLVPVSGYAQGVDWGKLFPTLSEFATAEASRASAKMTPQKKNRGFSSSELLRTYQDMPLFRYESLAVAPDGSVFVANERYRSLYKFDAAGRYIKTFGEKEHRMRDPLSAYRRPEGVAVLNGKSVIVREYSRIGLYDAEGRPGRFLEMKYPVMDCEALAGNAVAVAGTILLGNGGWKDIVVLKDLDTGKEVLLRESIRNEMQIVRIVQEGKSKKNVSVKPSVPSETILIRRAHDGGLILGSTDCPVVSIFDRTGKKTREFTLNIQRLTIDEKVKREYLQGLTASVRKYDLPEEIVKDVKKRWDEEMRQMPYYYNLIPDSDGNLLVFLFPTDKEEAVFQVYSPAGTFVCESRFDAGDFRLSFLSGQRKAAFHDGCLYALAEKRGASGSGINLVKFRLEN